MVEVPMQNQAKPKQNFSYIHPIQDTLKNVFGLLCKKHVQLCLQYLETWGQKKKRHLNCIKFSRLPSPWLLSLKSAFISLIHLDLPVSMCLHPKGIADYGSSVILSGDGLWVMIYQAPFINSSNKLWP